MVDDILHCSYKMVTYSAVINIFTGKKGSSTTKANDVLMGSHGNLNGRSLAMGTNRGHRDSTMVRMEFTTEWSALPNAIQ